jgi:hypothetical protein
MNFAVLRVEIEGVGFLQMRCEHLGFEPFLQQLLSKVLPVGELIFNQDNELFTGQDFDVTLNRFLVSELQENLGLPTGLLNGSDYLIVMSIVTSCFFGASSPSCSSSIFPSSFEWSIHSGTSIWE